MIKPPRLAAGGTIGLVCPASPPRDPELLAKAREALERFGFRVKVGRFARKRHHFLAGSDEERASDLMGFFEDKKVDAILCARGGYGTARLLPLLDFATIRRHPKILVGFSDVTALQAGLLKKAGLVTFHGPMASSHLAKEDLPAFTRASFARTLMEPHPAGSVLRGLSRSEAISIRRGTAEGILVGGNLSVLAMMVGTPWWTSLKKKILLLEDVDEAPYRLDRLLTFLEQSGSLNGVAGIALGFFAHCEDRRNPKEGGNWLEVIQERFHHLKVPIVAQLPFGHVPHHATIPLGVKARLDGKNADLEILESAVK